MNTGISTELVPMSAESYPQYLEMAIAGYAMDNVVAGRWRAGDAHALSQADFAESLPQGISTPDNHLFDIRDRDTGETVGYLWFAVVSQDGARAAYVYDIEIKPDYRRLGHARRAFAELERLVRGMALASIGLHVFAHNPGAQALYRSLGYGVTGHNMRKPLE